MDDTRAVHDVEQFVMCIVTPRLRDSGTDAQRAMDQRLGIRAAIDDDPLGHR
ncbi:MAG: hypothetical protein F2836_00655, partial [Actinobacteria bacterium]|nr:hypothetical protein [Actinomycetota bacterium]